MDNSTSPRRQPGQPPPGVAPRLRSFFSAPRRPAHHANPTSTSVHIAAEESDPKDDMVEREPSGEYRVAAPCLTSPFNARGTLKGDMDEAEDERRMIAYYQPGSTQDPPIPPGMMVAIKQALASSMERAAASLENDCWIFEGDQKRRR
ncbi:hypothetical protein P154DRAFT_617038 [Amniculicola lignicola CBS 123094]|uniref:Uncharacterized protein n=1 Tax=Amniculicola lignicola CBS 123094 TaxID=1392246 RepID=A0A6A5WRK3_9PLEO|nr:hypothetical protein P154DRAFT_617038 [Amniculicola lignicola CBS 123094]